ncbi:AmpG family muropeptide MFS transporter [Acuticoccus sp. I52.16.1]|uniref:AmpG family muropeptide MFS transporter n=1 Tax=Acuticoccus sp. I52.16.1 TaxID=2928472 RepID=UPI001FD12FB8|nr:AmpG family muropeptide MFS transporter [Acuticoccus sp. I52.16.1]UOM34421.1 AmpG family muropeptide MFS transporter [Acuticoccus sp. I52.16.1]
MSDHISHEAGGWREAVAVYTSRRQLVIFLMGFSSGLPLLLGFSTLSFWLREADVSLAAIGGLLTVATPYSLKFLWAPLLDHVRLPVLTRWLGLRRSWLLVVQLLLMGSIVVVGQAEPPGGLGFLAMAALVMAFLSATQDIVVDAYRIEILDEHEQGAGAAMTQAGYRVGMLASGAGALALADFMGWGWVYAIMAGLVVIGILGTLIAEEPVSRRPAAPDKPLAFLRHATLDPLKDFATRKGWVLILAFVLLYKYGDSVAGAMANPFYVDLGFSGVEIASVTKVFGVVMTMVGVFFGGALVARLGILPALAIGGVLQAATNLIFAWLATLGHDMTALAIAVGADNFTGGLGSAAFVAYLSSLCNLAFTATQYALLTSLMAFGRTMLAASSGWLAQGLGWPGFFMATALLAIPALVLLYFLSRLYAPPAPEGEAPAG